MTSVPATEAKNRFGELLNQIQREPVEIARQGKGVAVMLSLHDFEELQKRAPEKPQTSFQWLDEWREKYPRKEGEPPASMDDWYRHLDEKYGS
jgi:prevent-host-death family protein